MSDCKKNPTQNAWVKFTPRSGNQAAIIEYFGNGSCKAGEEWDPSPVPADTQTLFNLHRAGSPPNFTFFGISFWGRDESSKRVTNVVRSFVEGKGGDASFEGEPFVKGVSVTDNLIQFTASNCNPSSGGFISLQVTIESTIDPDGKLLTSIDPDVPIDKKN